MRVLFTLILGLLATVAFCAFFGLHSVLSYVNSPEAVTETAQQQSLHELVLKAADAILESEFRPPPGPRSEELRAFVRKEAHEVFRKVLSNAWFYEALTLSYTVILAILHDREERQVIELADKKARLLRELDGVAEQVGVHCRKLIDDPICDDEEGRRQAIAPVRRAIEDAIAQIPDRLHVQELAESAGQRKLRSDSPEMKKARAGHGKVDQVRSGALVGLIVLLLLIALINRPFPRVLISVGAVLAVASVTYLVAVTVAEDATQQAIAESMAERATSRIPAQGESVRGIAKRGTEQLVLGAAHDSIHHADGPVLALSMLGVLGFVAGIVLTRRRKRALPRAVAQPARSGASTILLMAGAGLFACAPAAEARPLTHSPSSPMTRSMPAGALLADLTWQQAERALTPDTVVVIPVGAAAKEHGPHLRLDNDLRIAEYFKSEVVRRAEVVVAPTIGAHFYPAFHEYPGSISLRLETARDLIVDVASSLAAFGPRRFYVLNTGVSTVKALKPAARILRERGLLMTYTDLKAVARRVPDDLLEQEGGSHADEHETSMMLVIAPDRVDMARAVKDYDPRPLPGMTRKGPDAGETYSPTGIFGDPTLATRAKGDVIVAAMLGTILEDIERLRAAPLPVSPP